VDAAERAELERRILAACDAAAWSEAATVAIRGYGPEIFGYLLATSGREQDASEAFSLLCENLWRGLPGFRGESTVRTWSYRLAQCALARVVRTDRRRRARIVPADAADIEAVAAQVRTATLPFLRTEVQAHVARLREQLAPEERALLVLRLDRRMSWDAIARVLGDDDPSPEDIKRSSATLRKRYERVKTRLRELSRGLAPPG
jgi:RNA polymerase sigma-70 factor (ECF subfamily)